MILKLVCLFPLTVSVLSYNVTEVSVKTPVGVIQGSEVVTSEGYNYTKFIGIPYGLVDEKNPFGNAKPYPPFTTPYSATNDSSLCPQLVQGIAKGNFQCLHLNVYTPTFIKPGHTLPVMVYIHGGAFIEGSGAFATFSPRFLTRYDVILVTMNYRLGAYGYLCLPSTEYTNQGLKDQIIAMKWVKKNIKSFGGDDENITLFGHSAGSMSAEYHLLYTEDNLFNKVIMQSGSVASSFINVATNVSTFVKDVGMDSKNIEVKRFIQTISAMDTATVVNITKSYDFRPCFDGELLTNNTPKFKKNINIMTGGTLKETLFMFTTVEQQENIDLLGHLNNAFSVSKMADITNATKSIKDFYFKNDKANLLNYTSDLAFTYPIVRSVRYYVRNNCTVYRYLFTYDSHRNYVKIRANITAVGPAHGDELGYLFYMPELEFKFGNNITDHDQLVIDRMTLMWTNFAKYGNPTPKTSLLLPVKWTPLTLAANSYLQINADLSIQDGRPFENRMVFWDAFYTKYKDYVKGIRLGDEFSNSACAVDLSGIVLLVGSFLCFVNKL